MLIRQCALQIIAARHLPRPGRSIASPFVEVELCGHTEEKSKTFVYRKEPAAVVNMNCRHA